MRTKIVIPAILVPLFVGLDQVTKVWAVIVLKPLMLEPDPAARSITIIDGFWRMIYAENPGAAWGLLRDTSSEFRVPFFVVISLVAAGFMFWFFRKLEAHQKMLISAISLIFAGAVGNLIDRVQSGRVVDFIQWYVTWGGDEHHWPTFNIADVAISIGVGLLLLDMLLNRKKDEKKSSKAAA